MSRFRRWLDRSGGRPEPETDTRLDLCFECGEVVASNCAVEAFDRQLDGEMDAIEAAAWRLERESFLAQADTFGTALRLDLLSADDFR
jgi:hypothetical protein